MAAILNLSNCVVAKDVFLGDKTQAGDGFASLTVKEGKDNKFVLTAFDDSRMDSPYKKLKQYKIRKGSHLNILCEVSTKDKELISSFTWKKLLKFIPSKDRESMFPGGANPTSTKSHYFRILSLEIVSGSVIEDGEANKENEQPKEKEIKDMKFDFYSFGGETC